MPHVKPRDGMFDVATYENSQTNQIRFVDGSTKSELCAPTIIPTPILYRLYYLGRAYDLQGLKRLRPDQKDTLGFLESQQICSELEFLNRVVTDPLLKAFSDEIESKLVSIRANTKCCIETVPPR
jgi:hypothetical protein